VSVEIAVERWAEQQFGDCELGDLRRTQRAVKLATCMAARPDGSTPDQTENWADCKAAYRLIGNQDVTFEALAKPHWQQTRQRPPGTYLLLNDTTTLDFGILRRGVTGLSAVGNGGGRGFLLHSALMVNADDEDIVGMAGQRIRYRQRVPKGDTHRKRRDRDRESKLWGQLIDDIGPPPPGARFIHVADRGADLFEAFCHCLHNKVDWVFRAAQLKRGVITSDGIKRRLDKYLESLPSMGAYELHVRANRKQPERTARVEVRFGALRMPRPRECSQWVRKSGVREIPMYVVEVREVDAPHGVEPLRWVLLTSLPVNNFDDAWLVISYYEKRPLVEEFHKALKTGCSVELRQYRTSERLEAITGMLSVLAVRLLQLKTIARRDPDRPARTIVPKGWLEMLRATRKGRHCHIQTVREFFRALAGLGGFLGRKGDGEPGWITIWRGVEKLLLLLRGANAIRAKCG
jgi:hypothetical protein